MFTPYDRRKQKLMQPADIAPELVFLEYKTEDGSPHIRLVDRCCDQVGGGGPPFERLYILHSRRYISSNGAKHRVVVGEIDNSKPRPKFICCPAAGF